MSKKERAAQRRAIEQAESARARSGSARRSKRAGAAPIRLTYVCEVATSAQVVDVSLDFSDRLVVATSAADGATTFAGQDGSPDSPTFPWSRSSQRYAIDVLVVSADGVSDVTTIQDLRVAFPKVQPTPDGFVVVGSRTRYRNDGPERNAWIATEDGRLVSSFCAGDGIESVEVTASGRMWVSYFDEGVLGNYGWGGRARTPLGQSGLVCWSLEGERLYEFGAPGGFSPMLDCYAMSTLGDEAWVCYYTEFPIVRVDAGFSATAWACGLRGAHALAVAPGTSPKVALVGDYDGAHDLVRLVDVESGRHRKYRLVMPDGTNVDRSARIVARGRFINVLAEGQWLRLDVADIAQPR